MGMDGPLFLRTVQPQSGTMNCVVITTINSIGSSLSAAWKGEISTFFCDDKT